MAADNFYLFNLAVRCYDCFDFDGATKMHLPGDSWVKVDPI
jgi:hypothetical protein